MKKALSFILAAVMLFTALPLTASAQTAADARLILRASVGLENQAYWFEAL